MNETKLPNDPMEAAYRRCVEQQAPDEQIDRNSFFAGFVAAQRVQQSEDAPKPFLDAKAIPQSGEPTDAEIEAAVNAYRAAEDKGYTDLDILLYHALAAVLKPTQQANDDAEVRIGRHRYEGKHTFGDETHSSITIGLDYPGDWTDNDLLAWLRKRGIK